MRFIKLFEELNSDRNTNVKIKERKYTKNGVETHESKFMFQDIVFFVNFYKLNLNQNKKQEAPFIFWERAYGTMEDGELCDEELGLGISDILNLMEIITKITIDFINKQNPDILCFNHKNMDNETSVPTNQLNKRARLNFRTLKGKLPTGYILSCWSNHQIFNDFATTTIIYKEGVDIEPLVKLKEKIV